MKNKVLALSAAVLLSAGIAFSFANTSTNANCCTAASATEACCDMPCPIDDCPIPCCTAEESAAAGCSK